MTDFGVLSTVGEIVAGPRRLVVNFSGVDTDITPKPVKDGYTTTARPTYDLVFRRFAQAHAYEYVIGDATFRRREKKPKNDRHQQGKQQTPRSRKAQTHAITMVSLRFRHISFVDFMMAFNFVRRSSLLNMAWARVHTAVHWLYPTENPV
ncbi:uncharacterized protein LOC129004619 [Macrosteles quadrilineatus]|uniref:uncharacterized protein LOC129004619 n=1 Tax=Macrosteles quadrilineatus TaxID=74068 RepID=UPI0023E0B1B3|nr:uncharacterized protein LOC129004619 [Macrosteles quadrilineatus]